MRIMVRRLGIAVAWMALLSGAPSAFAAEPRILERGDPVMPRENCEIRARGEIVSLKGRMLPFVIQRVEGDVADLGIGTAPVAELVHQKDAVDYYTSWIAREPRSVDAFHLRGTAHENLRHLQSAIDDYTAAINLAPDIARLYIKRGLIYSLLLDKKGAFTHREQVTQDAERALRLDPDEVLAVHLRLRVAQDAADEIQTTTMPIRLLRFKPKDELSWFLQGYFLNAYNRNFDAIECFNHCLESNPCHSPALGRRAYVYETLEKWDLALADHNRAREIDPKSVAVLSNRATFVFRLGQETECLRDMAKAVELEPENWELLVAYVERLTQAQNAALRKPELALEHAKKALELGGDHRWRLNFNLGVAYGDAGDYKTGLEYLYKTQKCERTSDDFEQVRLDVGIQRLIAGKPVWHD